MQRHAVLSPSVSSLYADALGAFLSERGLAPGTRSEGPRLCGNSYSTLMAGASRELGDRGLGLRFGARVGGAGFGMLGIAAATAPTLRESIRHLTQLESITSTLGRATVRRHGTRVHLSWQPAQPVPPAVVEGILAGWVSFGRYLLGEQVDVVQVSLRHKRIAAMDVYDGVFACPVHFGACCYGVTIGEDLLAARPRFADPLINESIGAWLGHCARAASGEALTVTRSVSALFQTSLPLAEADECTVAAMLGFERRSLQRALQYECTSFRQLVSAARAQHAIISLMRGGTSLSDLSADIGFDEQSSMCRAFKKWTGYSPLAFRQRVADVFSPLRA